MLSEIFPNNKYMTPLKFRFLIAPSAILIILLAGIYFITNYTNSVHFWFAYLVPAIAFFITIVCFIIVRKTNPKSNFGTVVMSIFGIKFFSYLALAFVFFLLEKNKLPRLFFTGLLFLTYLANTLLILRYAMNFFKTISDKHSNSE